MTWNRWMRQIHRWLSIIFTAAVIFDGIVVARGKYANWMGFLAVVPLFLLLFSGLYLFVLPYAAKWSSARRAGSTAI